MLESIAVAIFGVPIYFVAFCLLMCVIIAVLDAARTYTVGESRPLARMLERWGNER